MAEETKVASTLNDIFRNRLKTVDVHTLEQTIAKAVGDLVGLEFNCSIQQIEYGNGYSRQGAKFNVSLYEPAEKMFSKTIPSEEGG